MVKKFTAFFLFLALAFAPGAQGFTPKNHAELLKDDFYRENRQQYENIMAEAKERLLADEYNKLAADFETEIARGAAESIKAGDSETEAYATEYIAATERMNRELIFDWLRKNAAGVQGFYRFISEAYDGWLTVQEGDGPASWAISIFVSQKSEPQNNGELDGEGKLDGGRMAVNYGNDDASATITITFDGETARVETSRAFKESGWFGANVVIDGNYGKERK